LCVSLCLAGTVNIAQHPTSMALRCIPDQGLPNPRTNPYSVLYCTVIMNPVNPVLNHSDHSRPPPCRAIGWWPWWEPQSGGRGLVDFGERQKQKRAANSSIARHCRGSHHLHLRCLPTRPSLFPRCQWLLDDCGFQIPVNARSTLLPPIISVSAAS